MKSDGLPLPPPHLHALVSGSPDYGPDQFLEIGRGCLAAIEGLLVRRGLNIADFRAVLDFGCGCGRIIRHFRSTGPAKLHGTDYNPRLIEWCTANLPFARFQVNALHPPLNYPDAAFDFIYAFSVFTHLTQELQLAWMRELRRVLAPGGHLLLSAHGQAHADAYFSPDLNRQFDAGLLVVLHEEWAGENSCAVYHPVAFVRQLCLATGFEILEHAAGRMIEGQPEQDVYLLRRLDS